MNLHQLFSAFLVSAIMFMVTPLLAANTGLLSGRAESYLTKDQVENAYVSMMGNKCVLYVSMDGNPQRASVWGFIYNQSQFCKKSTFNSLIKENGGAVAVRRDSYTPLSQSSKEEQELFKSLRSDAYYVKANALPAPERAEDAKVNAFQQINGAFNAECVLKIEAQSDQDKLGLIGMDSDSCDKLKKFKNGSEVQFYPSDLEFVRSKSLLAKLKGKDSAYFYKYFAGLQRISQ